MVSDAQERERKRLEENRRKFEEEREHLPEYLKRGLAAIEEFIK